MEKEYTMACITGKKRNIVLKRDKFKCQYCGSKNNKNDLVIDHIYPKSKNGSNDLDNLITSCIKCNCKKNDHSLSDFKSIIKEQYAQHYDEIVYLRKVIKNLDKIIILKNSTSSK